jgi:hypothetical protein
MQSKDMKSLMDAYSQVILGESLEIDEARQMKDPKKDSMVVKGNKTIVIDKSKEKEYLKKGWELAEKKKLDPVDDAENDKKFKDRKDKDIDNDGDVDSSDEYLHKKRAATDDAIDGGKKPAKKEGNAFTQALKAAKDKGDDTFVVAGKKYDVTTKEEIEDEGDEEEKEAPKVAGKKDDKKKVASNAKTAEISKIGEDIDLTDAITDLHKMWESAAQKSNATKPEEIDSKESPKSKEFSKKHKVDKTDEEETHETASKAGRATKANSGKGSIDSKKGDNKIVKSTEVKEEVELDENRNLLKDYEELKKKGKSDSQAQDVLLSMPKYKRYDSAKLGKLIGDALRKGTISKKAPFKLAEGVLMREYEPGEYRKGDEKQYVALIKKNGGKNIDVEVPKGRDSMLNIQFKGGNLKKMQQDLSKSDDGLTSIDEGLVTGVRGKDGNTYAIELGKSGRKVTVRTKNQHGDIDTVDLKKAAKMFEGLEGLESLDESAEDIIAQAQNIINGKSIAEIADLTSDKPVSKYDGRTKEARAFLQRMAERRGKYKGDK